MQGVFERIRREGVIGLVLFGLIAAPGLGSCTRPSESVRVQERRSSRPVLEEPMKETQGRETVVLAGGCFWGMEELLRGIDGVLETEVGYAGGATPSPVYETVKTGRTGHAESVRVVFDPARISFAELLEKWFFRMHDPTTVDRQGNDRGSQYRSAIFATSDEQMKVAREVIAKVDASGVWPKPIVTEVVAAVPFTPAEDYHQDYLQAHPNGYTCHYMRNF
jgi:peptide methionine sulfoxide reductase msrA/msrB